MALKQIMKNGNLLNCLLITLSLIFTYKYLIPQSNGNPSFVLPQVTKKPAETAKNESPKTQAPSPMDYVIIADQNLFHPERRIPPDKKEEAALPKPEFILYGTLITSEMQMAYMEDKKAPVSTPGRGKRQSALKKGESLSGFTLKEVKADKVVMARGEETLAVLLEDQKSPKGREGAAGSTASHSKVPGIPGLPSPSIGGQSSVHPPTPGIGAIPPGGRLPNPTPNAPPMGVGIPPQPAFPGAIAPSTPSSPAFPSRRQRYMQSLQQ
jgi:hypothetical protein